LAVIGSIAAAGGAGFLDGLFDGFTGFAGALLNPPQQLFLFAFGILQIAIRELGPFLFQLALGDVPVAFDFKCGHNRFCLFDVCFESPPTMTAKGVSAVSGHNARLAFQAGPPSCHRPAGR
jgi:hypothetical protein